jgi:Virulence-associated protein E
MNKPKTIGSDLAHLPRALKPLIDHDHWLLWLWEFRRGIWTKPPYSAVTLGTHAKNNDPKTWASYQAAIAAAQAVKADGIGFALLNTPFDVVDLDHCLDPESGQPDSWAQIWLEAANGAYVERTPSGEGLRIIGGTNPNSTEKLHRKWPVKDGREKAAIEIYRNCERYITITGAQLGECKELSQIDLLDQIKAHYSGEASSTKSGNGKNSPGFDFNQAGTTAGAIDWDTVIQNGAPPNADVSAVFHSVVGHLSNKGLSAEEITNELGKWINGIGQRYAGRLQQEVERSHGKWQAKQLRILAPAESKQQGGDDQEPEEEAAWAGTRKGIPLSNGTNARRALKALGIKCRYDVFHDKIEVRGKNLVESVNLDHVALMLRIKIHKAFKFDPGTKHVLDAMIQLGIENKFDPVRDYLDALVWDGEPRLDCWLATYLGAEDTELNAAFGRIALIAAVRRVRRPGCKFDPIIVLEGPMGTQKSKTIETLAGVENFSDQTILGARDREQQELLAGVWLFEIAELSGMKRADVEHIKAFASRTHDRARPAYGRSLVDQPRRCVLFATTNDDQYLKAVDRRFWPVRTATIDIEALKRDRNQLWAEAAQRDREGASIVLDRSLWGSAHVEQQAREEHDPWDDQLANLTGEIEQGEERVSSHDILTIALGIHISRQRDIDYKKLGRCMRRLGWDGPKSLRIGGKPVAGYSRPSTNW